MPNVVDCYLDSAVAKVQAAGVSSANIAFTTLGQNSVVLLESDWIVLTQSPTAGGAVGAGIVHLGVVKLTDPKASGITPMSCA
jgi:acetyl-CoA carboxylase beta subunit